MRRSIARRLPLVGTWVSKLEALEAKYFKLKAQRDSLKRQRDHLESELARARAPFQAIQREKDKQRALRTGSSQITNPFRGAPFTGPWHG